MAWFGDAPRTAEKNCRVRLYLSEWVNPNPEMKVVKIDYSSRKTETAAAPFCVAMSVEEK